MRKLIFLDIDGVLNCQKCFASHHKEWEDAGKPKVYKWWSMIEPAHMAHLNKIIAETGAQIVISSSWRGDPKTPDILRENGLVGEIIGVTPRMHRPEGTSWDYYERGKEIQAWMEKNIAQGEEFTYVILEDESDILPEQVHIKTSWSDGLEEKHAHSSIRLLNGERCLTCKRLMKPHKDDIAFKHMGFAWTGHSWTCDCFPSNLVLSVG